MKTQFLVPMLSLCVAAATLPARAATFVVDRTDDTFASACTGASNDCSLRGAVSAANAATTGDIITFNAATFASARTIVLANGELSVSNKGTLAVNGPKSSVTISGNNASRVWNIAPGANVAFDHLNTANGNSGGNSGGGILNDRGTLSLTDCTIRNNKTGTDGDGGGIYNNGQNASVRLTIQRCTFHQNITGNVNAGGAIYNNGFNGDARLSISNSTFSANEAFDGGAILNAGDNNDGQTAGAITTINNSTLANNTAFQARASGIFNSSFNQEPGGATLVIANTIFSNSTKRADGNLNIINDGGDVNSNGFNISSDNSYDSSTTPKKLLLNKPSDQNDTDPKLGALANNGGPTQTFALLTGSPAINAGDPNFDATQTPTDQRGQGFARVGGGRIDIGAFEVQKTGTAPVANPDSFRLDEEMRLLVSAAQGVLANDSDADANTKLSVSLVTAPKNGRLALRRDGSFSFIPGRNFAGRDSFVYAISDGKLSASATVNLIVSSINDTPQARDVSPRTSTNPVGQDRRFTVFVGDADGAADLQSIMFHAGTSPSATGGATVEYRPATNQLFLRDGTNVNGPITPGSGTLSNSFVSLSGNTVEVMRDANGQTMSVSFVLRPKAPLEGKNIVWVRVQDQMGALDPRQEQNGFVRLGLWRVVPNTTSPTTSAPSGSGS